MLIAVARDDMDSESAAPQRIECRNRSCRERRCHQPRTVRDESAPKRSAWFDTRLIGSILEGVGLVLDADHFSQAVAGSMTLPVTR
jgi:hypothetical protein